MNKTNGVNYFRFLLVGAGILCVGSTPVFGETVTSDKSDIMKISITNDSRISGVVVDQTGYRRKRVRERNDERDDYGYGWKV